MQKTEHSVAVANIEELRAAACKIIPELGDVPVMIGDKRYLPSYLLKLTDTALSTFFTYPITLIPVFSSPADGVRGLGNNGPHWPGEMNPGQT